MKPPLSSVSSDDFQAPPSALTSLLPFLKAEWVLWECAEGEGHLTRALNSKGFEVVGSDISTGKNFLTWQPSKYDCIVTNPPYSQKQGFLERAYQLKKPFAFLLPLTALETQKRQRLYRKYGVQIILLGKRVTFKTPSGKGSGAWFVVAWFTNWLNLPQQLIFENSKQLELELGIGNTSR